MYAHHLKRSILIIALLILSSVPIIGQDLIGVVDYMKVDNPAEYIEVEKNWQKIHEVRLKKGLITGWGVYEVMFKPLDSPYNFVSISWYDSFSKLDKNVSNEILDEAFPEKSKDDWVTFMDRTEKSRKRLTSAVFQQRLSSSDSLDHAGKYYVINEINIKSERSNEYLELKKEICKPMFEEAVRNKNIVSWSLWAKWTGTMKGHQYLSADGYTSLEQIEEVDYLQYFQKVHPNKNKDQFSNKVKELENLVNSEIWKTRYRIFE